MKIDNFIRLFAGTIVLSGVALAHFVNSWWLLLVAFAGFNLAQSALTGFCPPTLLFRKLGWLDGNNVIHWGGVRRGA